MIRHITLHRHDRLKAMLVVCCAAVVLVVTTPCAMALAATADTASLHDCPHCPPQPCHDTDAGNDCDELNPVDKPRNDSGAETTAAVSRVPTGEQERPPRAHTPSPGPPPARDGPRRHLILATFNE